VEALPDQVVRDEALPAEPERVDDQLGVAVFQLGLEAVGVDDLYEDRAEVCPYSAERIPCLD